MKEVAGVEEVVGAEGVPASVRRSRRMGAGGWANRNGLWREDLGGQPNMGSVVGPYWSDVFDQGTHI